MPPRAHVGRVGVHVLRGTPWGRHEVALLLWECTGRAPWELHDKSPGAQRYAILTRTGKMRVPQRLTLKCL